MTVTRIAGYTALTILTIGTSQVIAILGLLATAIKEIYDRIQLARYRRVEINASSDIQRKYRSKIKYYTSRLKNNVLYAKAFGCTLVSLTLNYHAKYLFKSAIGIGIDILRIGGSEALAKRITYIALKWIGPTRLMSRCFYPGYSGLNRQSKKIQNHLEEKRRFLIEELHGKEKILKSGPKADRALKAYWVPSRQTEKNSPTVIIFHGMGGCAELMYREAEIFSRYCSVLLINRDQAVFPHPTETSVYEDANAAFEFVIKQPLEQTGNLLPNNRIIFYGKSIGSIEATYLASQHQDTHLILNLPLLSMQHTIDTVLRGYLPYAIIPNKAAKKIASNLIEVLFRSGIQVGMGNAKTNGGDNLSRISHVTGSFFAFYRKQDKFMSRNKRNAAEILEEAYNRDRDNKEKATICGFEGGHLSFDILEEAPKNALLNHLDRITA